MSKFVRHVEGVLLFGECQWWTEIGDMTFDFFESQSGIDLHSGSEYIGSYTTMRAAVNAARRHAGVAPARADGSVRAGEGSE